MTTFINLTPHPLTVLNSEGVQQDPKRKTFHPQQGVEPQVIKEIPPEGGDLPRVSQETEQVGEEEDIPLFRTTYGEIHNLPAPQEGVFLICSGLVATAAAAQGRGDVLSPSQLVRDGEGKILGCLGFQLPS